jgi:phosphate transport system permease protein
MATSATLPAHSPPGARSFFKRLTSGDEIARLVTTLFASLILLLTLGIVWELWIHSALARQKFGFSFLTSTLWNPVTDQFGALPFIYGTVITSVLALLIAVPLGRRRGYFSRGARAAAYFKHVYFLH